MILFKGLTVLIFLLVGSIAHSNPPSVKYAPFYDNEMAVRMYLTELYETVYDLAANVDNNDGTVPTEYKEFVARYIEIRDQIRESEEDVELKVLRPSIVLKESAQSPNNPHYMDSTYIAVYYVEGVIPGFYARYVFPAAFVEVNVEATDKHVLVSTTGFKNVTLSNFPASDAISPLLQSRYTSEVKEDESNVEAATKLVKQMIAETRDGYAQRQSGLEVDGIGSLVDFYSSEKEAYELDADGAEVSLLDEPSILRSSLGESRSSSTETLLAVMWIQESSAVGIFKYPIVFELSVEGQPEDAEKAVIKIVGMKQYKIE